MNRKYKFLLIGLMISLFLVPSGWANSSLGELANETVVVTGAPNAVSAGLIVNPDGRGDTLVFPYYDVRTLNGKGQQSLFLIINESATGGGQIIGNEVQGDGVDTGIIARIGFREWDKSIEVLDFHIYLSDEDVWVGQVTLNGNLGNIKSPDFVVVDATNALFYLAKPWAIVGPDFSTLNINYTPPGGLSKDQLTQMGYIEVIGEEAVAKKPTASSGSSPNTGQPFTHTVARTFLDCPNNMMGTLYILRTDDGVAMGYNATALANFSRNAGSLFGGLGLNTPTLAFAEDTLDQVEFVLSKEDIFGAYSIETEIGASASLLITFPTKHFHYNDSGLCRSLIVGSNNPFSAACENDGEEITAKIWDRDENFITIQQGFISPQPPGQKVVLPYEVNIIGFYPGTTTPAPVGGAFFGIGRDNIAFPVGTFRSGWAWINFPANVPVAGAKIAFPVLIDFYQYYGNLFDEYNGLPALGLQIQEFFNGVAGGFYGETVPAWYEVEWFLFVPPPIL